MLGEALTTLVSDNVPANIFHEEVFCEGVRGRSRRRVCVVHTCQGVHLLGIDVPTQLGSWDY